MPIDKFRHGHGPVEISELSEFQRDEILIDISFVIYLFIFFLHKEDEEMCSSGHHFTEE